MLKRIATAIFFLGLLGACAGSRSIGPVGQPLAPGVSLILPDRPAFASGLSVTQLVQARFQDRNQTFQSFIESGASRFSVLMTVPSGPRIMKINWSKGAVSAQKEPIAPEALSAERMLADLMLVYASDEVLRTALQGGTLEVGPKGTRKIVRNGTTMIAVTRPAGDVWVGRSVLENFAFDYELNIQSQRVSP